MGKKHLFLIFLAAAAGFICPPVQASEINPESPVYQMEAQFQAQLRTRTEAYDRPKATCYYDDLVDHYEQDQLMRDVIAQGI